MRALKLVEHMKANAGRMSEAVLRKIRASNRCRELLAKVPVDEHKQYALDIYSDLTAWLSTETESKHRGALRCSWTADELSKASHSATSFGLFA